MGTGQSLIVPLAAAGATASSLIGGKGRTLGRLIDAGYRVPGGFCLTVRAYERFVAAADLSTTLQMELGRKSFATMRWEEIWDAALRIRSAFLAAPIPDDIAQAVAGAYRELGAPAVAVRSSAPGEDSADQSHAGLHESLVGVRGEKELLDAVRIVWASLWSDAALLYRRELGMDVDRSCMAVVVQEFVAAEMSGVGFGIDPRHPELDRQMVEAVPGFCEDLVSGAVDPDRWIMKRSTGELVEWTPGSRGGGETKPILERTDLDLLHTTLRSVESLLGCPPDVEWTGHADNLTLLQARPVTGPRGDKDDDRAWYLSLRPGKERLRDLCARVSEELIPALEATAAGFAAEDISSLPDGALADAIAARKAAHDHWTVVYKDEFIPFAHGVRHLGMYYNDAVRPEDPYEFVGLLRNQPMIASQRNTALAGLAALVRQDPDLAATLAQLAATGKIGSREDWREQTGLLPWSPKISGFLREFEHFLDHYLDITFDDQSLDDRPDLALQVVLEMARGSETKPVAAAAAAAVLEEKLWEAVGSEREAAARDVLRIGRLSWVLRDDDNILMGRLKRQLLNALVLGSERLEQAGRLDADVAVSPATAAAIVRALREPDGGKVTLPAAAARPRAPVPTDSHESPRQLIGQPAAPGWAAGSVRIVRDAADFALFQRGEVMVCDAIQPTMTHLVPLASAIVERRGGMLIHGAIIARELAVPCVNGVPDATMHLSNGDFVTVDGHLGIVTVGPPEFDLELGAGNGPVPSP